jgi:hypothetical protein
MGGSARLRFATLRAGVEFFDHAAKCALERRCVLGTCLFSELISVMVHRDTAVGANHWIGFSHFNNLNEGERSPGRIAVTPDPRYFLRQIVNPSRIAGSSMSEYPRLLADTRQSLRTQSQIRRFGSRTP